MNRGLAVRANAHVLMNRGLAVLSNAHVLMNRGMEVRANAHVLMNRGLAVLSMTRTSPSDLPLLSLRSAARHADAVDDAVDCIGSTALTPNAQPQASNAQPQAPKAQPPARNAQPSEDA